MPSDSTHICKPGNTIISIVLIAIAMALLIGGGLIYIAFRSVSLRMFGWFDTLGIIEVIDEMRLLSEGLSPNHFILYNLPDLLWITSYLLFVNALIPRIDRGLYLFWVLFMPVLAIVHELMQGFGLAVGSFDYIDLLCYILPTAINIITINFSKFNIKLNPIKL